MISLLAVAYTYDAMGENSGKYLKAVQQLSTYYVYDDMGDLSFVLHRSWV